MQMFMMMLMVMAKIITSRTMATMMVAKRTTMMMIVATIYMDKGFIWLLMREKCTIVKGWGLSLIHI